MRERLRKLKERAEVFLRDFEWTWTTAVVFSLAFTSFLLITAVVIPSFWMYFAEQKLGWGGPTDVEAFLQQPLGSEGLLELRDAVAMGLTTGPIVTVMIAAVVLQNWRRRLRGASADRPTGGYR
jgi:ABC-type Fe3+ transport system permease subunit